MLQVLQQGLLGPDRLRGVGFDVDPLHERDHSRQILPLARPEHPAAGERPEGEVRLIGR
jgi:hypothetical protein